MDRALRDHRDLLPPAFATALQRYAQDRAQRREYRIRLHTLKMQDHHDTLLAFAKPE
jgi:hypothetical protein